jgi:hypothetical protein
MAYAEGDIKNNVVPFRLTKLMCDLRYLSTIPPKLKGIERTTSSPGLFNALQNLRVLTE